MFTRRFPHSSDSPRWQAAMLLLSSVLIFLAVSGGATQQRPPDDALAAAQQQACLSNMKQIGLAFKGYLDDYDDHMPPMKTAESFQRSLESYLPAVQSGGEPERERVFYCPASGLPYHPTARLSERPASEALGQVLVRDQRPHPTSGYWNALYLFRDAAGQL